jgi:acetyl esterase/lipase
LDQAGIPVKLDIHNAMPHGFMLQPSLEDTPESKIAFSKINDSLKEYLKY